MRFEAGALAGAIAADEGDELARADGQADAAQGLDRAVAHAQIADFQHRFASGGYRSWLIGASIVLRPEIGFDDQRVGLHLRGRPSAIFSP